VSARDRDEAPPLEALEALLASRRSVRSFRAEAPSDALIERLLAAAVTAPSASNKQPWRFLVVRSAEAIARMAAAVRRATSEIAAHVPEASQCAFRAYGEYFTRFEHAPVVVVPICRGAAVLSHLVDDALDAGARARIGWMERGSALTSTSLALGNLLVAAHAAGLGASAMTGPLVAADALRMQLDVPESWDIVALVPLGFAAETPAKTERKDVAKVTRWIR
jgi:nitroreductase